ncbi:uncharacterized protein LAJ45_03006 [Morchella importuna]|uniref:uncharacterized protein n=1 Tax=Morchella importuna TaxID=1174673 RepID=UPI001E8CBC41|nr:uncharacterized protein LAJ45_03006 [Morchella importuna]KAH8152781.1 hypothetical protein LAJ45_03006 [Morchella importuna]
MGVASLMEMCENPNSDLDNHERKQINTITMEKLLHLVSLPEVGDDIQGNTEERQVEAEERQMEAECVVCSDETPDTVLVPCGHLALCSGCCDTMGIKERGARNWSAVRCPLCRTAVEYRIKVFKA